MGSCNDSSPGFDDIRILIYIYDIANICKRTMPIFFTDDSNLFINGKDESKI